MKNTKLYAWSCDFSSNTGEGILSQNFCKTFSNKEKFLIKLSSPHLSADIYNSKIKFTKRKKLIINVKFLHYVYPFVGIVILWLHFFFGRKVMYLNYLPLWNFLIFILLPPKTVLGPITGGSQIQKNKNNLIRKYLFPQFYKISLFILNIRQKKFLFSTNLLKKFIDNKTQKKSFFLFCLNILEEKIKIKKKQKGKIDILFYYNRHPHKFNQRIIKLINDLSKHNIKIACVGENFPNKKIINFGKVSRHKVWEVMSISKISLMNSENFLSIYLLDCIKCNLKIFCNLKEFTYFKKYFFRESFFIYDRFKDDKKIIQYILSSINKPKRIKKTFNFKNYVKKINKKNLNYFSSLLVK
tara:strand:+ start:380 stop:1444 length:1065 start_codon:yes stop_codon:yes gene_type:complete